MRRSTFTGSILTFVVAIFFALPPASALHADNALIPGDINRMCFYTAFFYPFPPEDFFYHLNDRLLFREKPDGILFENGLRNKLLKIVHRHKIIKEFLRRFKKDKSGRITINVTKSRGYTNASALLALLGLGMEKSPDGGYRIAVNINRDPKSSSAPEENDYFNFALLDTAALSRELNKTRQLDFKLKESEIPTPWDFGFLRKITGLKIDSSTFFETMLKNERFSLLLGILYRLSDREINYIDNLVKKPLLGAWKKIYKDKRFLMGMFVLSGALRVVENENRQVQWALPGGTAAEAFWSELAEADYKKFPLGFLRRLATKDEGKLNYLYLFSTFLPAEAQKALFTGTNSEKMRLIYHLVTLTAKEELKPSRFPRLADSNFYTLLYALRMQDNRFYLPLAADGWIDIIRDSYQDPGMIDTLGEVPENPGILDLLKELLERANAVEVKAPADEIRKFVSLYTKFSHRPQLITKETMSLMVAGYDNYNVLLDFIEKLPIRKPGTVLKLFDWVERFESLDKKERALFTSIFQSILELLSHTAKYAPQRYDYDELMEKMMDIPFSRSQFYDNLWEFFDAALNINADKTNLMDFILAGIDNRVLEIDNTRYKFMIKDIYREKIQKILQTQEVCTWPALVKINRLFRRLLAGANHSAEAVDIVHGITEAFHGLPYAEISHEAPRFIRERVMPYSRGMLIRDLAYFIQHTRNKKEAGKKDLIASIETLKKGYLLYHLRDYLLASAYAVNAKNPELNVFLNPNLVRLHDFDGHKDRTAWNCCGTFPGSEDFPGFYFYGGLSRLNNAFAAKWIDYLFSRTIIANRAHVQSVIINLLDAYPVHPLNLNRDIALNSKLVDLGFELLQKSREDKALRQDVIKKLSTVTAGYHYRKAVRYLTGKSNRHHLFLSEIKGLAERFLQPQRFCGIYYRTFGSLVPKQIRLFPQDIATFFDSGRLSGEMIEEFKIKSYRLLYEKKIPLYLEGQILYSHFNETAPAFFSQNHVKDYFSTYYISDLFNHARLRSILKNLQRKGYLKLK